MLSVAICESGLKINARNVNKDGSTDGGVFQINAKYHGATLKQMGLDRYNYLDNISYGLFLAQTEGLKHWSASKKCWQSEKVRKEATALIDV